MLFSIIITITLFVHFSDVSRREVKDKGLWPMRLHRLYLESWADSRAPEPSGSGALFLGGFSLYFAARLAAFQAAVISWPSMSNDDPTLIEESFRLFGRAIQRSHPRLILP